MDAIAGSRESRACCVLGRFFELIWESQRFRNGTRKFHNNGFGTSIVHLPTTVTYCRQLASMHVRPKWMSFAGCKARKHGIDMKNLSTKNSHENVLGSLWTMDANFCKTLCLSSSFNVFKQDKRKKCGGSVGKIKSYRPNTESRVNFDFEHQILCFAETQARFILSRIIWDVTGSGEDSDSLRADFF